MDFGAARVHRRDFSGRLRGSTKDCAARAGGRPGRDAGPRFRRQWAERPGTSADASGTACRAAGATPRTGERRNGGTVFIAGHDKPPAMRSEEHTSELQSLMRIPYAVFSLKKNTHPNHY